MRNRYIYISREAMKDTMIWSSLTEEEIEERLINFVPIFYDTVEKTYISVEEYENRKK